MLIDAPCAIARFYRAQSIIPPPSASSVSESSLINTGYRRTFIICAFICLALIFIKSVMGRRFRQMSIFDKHPLILTLLSDSWMPSRRLLVDAALLRCAAREPPCCSPPPSTVRRQAFVVSAHSFDDAQQDATGQLPPALRRWRPPLHRSPRLLMPCRRHCFLPFFFFDAALYAAFE